MQKICIMLCLFVSFAGLCAQDEANLSVDEILRNVDGELRGERYESAIRMILKARQTMDDPALAEKLGDIYFDQEFFEPALQEYQSITEPDQHALLRVAECFRRLNRDVEAVVAFEIYLSEYPSDLAAVADYGWALFKIDQYSKGINFILSYTENGFADTALLMTLGTLYSGLYDLENSRKYYLKSIKLAETRGYIQTQAIGYYNLAIIESEFDEFEEALAHAQTSLELLPRYSAYLQMGDFSWQRAEYQKTEEYYEEAYKTDETKFSLLSLLELYLQTGKLEEASAIADQLLQDKNHLWMHNWGISLDSYYRSLHRAVYQLWEQKARMIAWTSAEHPFHALELLWQWLLALLKSWYHFGVFVSHSVTLMFQGMYESSQQSNEEVLINANVNSIDEMYGISSYAITRNKYSALSGSNWKRLAPRAANLIDAKMAMDSGRSQEFLDAIARISEEWFIDEKTMLLGEYTSRVQNTPALNAEAAVINPGLLLYYGAPLIFNVESNIPLNEITNGGILHNPESPHNLRLFDSNDGLVFELQMGGKTFPGVIVGESKSQRGRRLLEDLYKARR